MWYRCNASTKPSTTYGHMTARQCMQYRGKFMFLNLTSKFKSFFSDSTSPFRHRIQFYFILFNQFASDGNECTIKCAKIIARENQTNSFVKMKVFDPAELSKGSCSFHGSHRQLMCTELFKEHIWRDVKRIALLGVRRQSKSIYSGN